MGIYLLTLKAECFFTFLVYNLETLNVPYFLFINTLLNIVLNLTSTHLEQSVQLGELCFCPGDTLIQ